jgi:alkylation response protein AidB-like acyl-CoA dehydrogenase
MDLSLSESQKMLKTAARDFLKQECPWTAIKQIDESEDGFSRELWRKIAGMGWLGMNFPESCGGIGCSLSDLAVIYEEMGQILLPGIFFSSSVLCGSIVEGIGTEEQKQEILPAVASGDRILALAFTEPDYGWGPENIRMRATTKGDKFILTGTKRFVHDAQIADQLLVAVRTGDPADVEKTIALLVVDKGTPGFSCRTLSAFSGEKLSELTFDSVEVPAAKVLGQKDCGWQALSNALNRATAILCAYMVGGCQHLLDMTVQYARTRVQFGQPIGAFQWVQGYVIEQANQLERCRWLTWEALWKMDSGRSVQEQNEAVSLAKSVASEAFLECGHLGHEVHAGLGVDKKYPLYLYSKKSKTLYSYLGDPYYHRRRIARILGL